MFFIATPQSHIPEFLKEHPEFAPIIYLYTMAWEDSFGKDIVIDVVKSEFELSVRQPLYDAAGYKLVDSNCFGNITDTIGVACCYVKKTE